MLAHGAVDIVSVGALGGVHANQDMVKATCPRSVDVRRTGRNRFVVGSRPVPGRIRGPTMVRIAVNGFGRMGRLFVRAAADRTGLEVVSVNEPKGDPESLALLLEFDSSQGRWDRACRADGAVLHAGAQRMHLLQHESWDTLPWRELGIDLVVDCSGRVKAREKLEPHFRNGARKVLVSNPVPGVPNLV